jgi:YgiT-type zinc finger domain-containing protein
LERAITGEKTPKLRETLRSRMKCNTEKQSMTTHIVNNKNCVIVVKNVPCEECEQCGEKYYTDAVAEQLEILVNEAKKLMQEIAVIDYAKVA